MKLVLTNSNMLFRTKRGRTLNLGLNGYYAGNSKTESMALLPYATYAVSEILELRAGQTITIEEIAGNGVGVIARVDSDGDLTASTFTTALVVSIKGITTYSYTATSNCRVLCCGLTDSFTHGYAKVIIE